MSIGCGVAKGTSWLLLIDRHWIVNGSGWIAMGETLGKEAEGLPQLGLPKTTSPRPATLLLELSIGIGGTYGRFTLVLPLSRPSNFSQTLSILLAFPPRTRATRIPRGSPQVTALRRAASGVWLTRVVAMGLSTGSIPC